MSKRTLFLIFALFIITSVLLVLALYTPSNPKPTLTVTVPKETVEQTVLSFGEPVATSSSLAALSYSIPVNITTGKNKVTAVQLEMQYDPKILTNVVVTPGVFFKNPVILLNQIDAKTGRISYAFGINPTDQAVMGQGIIATLTFGTKTTALEQTQILFLPKTLVTAENISEPVLKQTNNIQFTIGEITSTPSAPSAGGLNQ